MQTTYRCRQTRALPAARLGGWLLVLPLLVALCSAALAQSGAAPAPATPASVAPAPASAALQGLRALSSAFVEVSKRVTPAVVNISSTRVERPRSSQMPGLRAFFPDLGDLFEQPAREVVSLGSGVIMRADGYIVTNWHVVQGAQEITVTLSDNRELEGRVVGQDAFTDVAVLKIAATGLPVAQFSDSDALQVGEWVLAIGSPMGFSQTVTSGIVSATRRRDVGISGVESFIQTDAAINPGNSGGALVNLDGKVVGINTAIVSEGGHYEGICFATPTSIVLPVVQALMRDGSIRRSYIGVVPRTVNRDLARRLSLSIQAGAVVTGILRNSPARQAGVQAGDVIVAWNDREVQNVADLAGLIQATTPGTGVKISVMRDGKRYSGQVVVGERPQDLQTRGVQ